MALFEPGPLTGGISGNVSGVNFVHATRSVYLRTKRARTSALSKKQLDVQTNMNILCKKWNALAFNSRVAWNISARAFPHVNRLGTPTRLNGREFFFFRNLRNLSFPGLAYNATPPTMITTIPSNDVALDNSTPATLTIAVLSSYFGPGLVRLAWVSRTYSNAPRRNFTRWTPLRPAGLWSSGDNQWPYIIAAVGTPQLNERIAFKVILRHFNELDSGEKIANIIITNP